jgi:radical SAM protein with 4Fe4S-binding SPASM domain
MRPRITYYKYLYYFVCCGSIKKIYNYILNKIEKKFKRVQLKSLPVNIMIEPCNICNLKCLGCITGTKHEESIEPQMLNLEQFKKIFDQCKEYVFNISLYNWGEPFLNKDIFSIVDYATSNKCAVTVHSNFNIFDESMAEKAILSRLTHIYLAIDGATQETYGKYRKGGDLSRVFKNIEMLVHKKKENRSIFPLLTWRYLIFPHNFHEIELARRKSKQLNIDAFEVSYANLDNIATFGVEKRYDLITGNIVTHNNKFCNSLWDTVIIYPDGSVIPCCQSFRKKDIFGNLNGSSIREVWNNKEFVTVRKIISTKKIRKDIRHPCCECKIIENLQRN